MEETERLQWWDRNIEREKRERLTWRESDRKIRKEKEGKEENQYEDRTIDILKKSKKKDRDKYEDERHKDEMGRGE